MPISAKKLLDVIDILEVFRRTGTTNALAIAAVDRAKDGLRTVIITAHEHERQHTLQAIHQEAGRYKFKLPDQYVHVASLQSAIDTGLLRGVRDTCVLFESTVMYELLTQTIQPPPMSDDVRKAIMRASHLLSFSWHRSAHQAVDGFGEPLPPEHPRVARTNIEGALRRATNGRALPGSLSGTYDEEDNAVYSECIECVRHHLWRYHGDPSITRFEFSTNVDSVRVSRMLVEVVAARQK